MGLARSLSEHYVAELGDRMVRKSKIRVVDVVNLFTSSRKYHSEF